MKKELFVMCDYTLDLFMLDKCLRRGYRRCVTRCLQCYTLFGLNIERLFLGKNSRDKARETFVFKYIFFSGLLCKIIMRSSEKRFAQVLQIPKYLQYRIKDKATWACYDAMRYVSILLLFI